MTTYICSLASLRYTGTAIIFEKIGPLSSHSESIFTHADFFLSSCAICFKGNSHNTKVSHAQVQSFRRCLKHRARKTTGDSTFDISTLVLWFNKTKGKQVLLNNPFLWSTAGIRLLPIRSAGVSAVDTRPAQTSGPEHPPPKGNCLAYSHPPAGKEAWDTKCGLSFMECVHTTYSYQKAVFKYLPANG